MGCAGEEVGGEGCKSQQEASLTEESLVPAEAAERDTASNESFVQDQLEEEVGESSEKCGDDDNNGAANQVNELEEPEITPVAQDVTAAEPESQGNEAEIEIETEQEEKSDNSDADNGNDEEEEEEKSTEAFDENLIESSGSESLESKSEDLNSEEGSEEGVTTDEGIVESDEDNNGSEENFETLKSKQCADVISEEAALESAD